MNLNDFDSYLKKTSILFEKNYKLKFHVHAMIKKL